MKYKLQYKCRLCGGQETLGEINLIDPPAHIFIEKHQDPIWHECFKAHPIDKRPPIGFGICDFVGMIPVREKEKTDGGE